jgi:hypothetical protein
MSKKERVRLLPTEQTGIQDIDGGESIAATSSSLWNGVSSIYTGVFGRKGWLSAAPMPCPNLPADTEEWVGNATQWGYFGIRDAMEKTLSFFAAQSGSASFAGLFVKVAPGQAFDIRKILMVQANQNFSAYYQLKNVGIAGGLSAIFWLVRLPLIGRAVLSLAYYCMKPETKEYTADSYVQANSWRSCFALYGMQALEVLLANIIVNTMVVMLGTSEKTVFDNPELINGMKVALAIGLDLLRNGLEKTIAFSKEKGLPCAPGSYVQVQP